MAGFDVSRTVYKLTFDDPRFDGFEVSVQAMSVLETWAYNDAVAEAATPSAVTRLVIETIGAHLLSWNAQRGGEPVPATIEGLTGLDDHYISAIMSGWLKAIRPAEAAEAEQEADPTAAGDSSLEGSLPMSPLTEPAVNGSVPAG